MPLVDPQFANRIVPTCTGGTDINQQNWRRVKQIVELMNNHGQLTVSNLGGNSIYENTLDGGGGVGLGGNFGVIFRNEDSVYCPSRGIMRLLGTQIGADEDGGRAGNGQLAGFTGTGSYYRIMRPNTSFKRRYLVNISPDVPAGDYGVATFMHNPGWLMVAHDLDGQPAVDEEWGAVPNQWYLRKNRPGYMMTGLAVGTDPWSLFTVTDHTQFWLAPGGCKFVETVIGKTSGSVSVGGTDTITVWAGASIATLATTGQTIADAENWGPAITGVTYVTVAWPHGKPIFVKRCT